LFESMLSMTSSNCASTTFDGLSGQATIWHSDKRSFQDQVRSLFPDGAPNYMT